MYYLRLHAPICQLTGLPLNDEVCERYFDLMSQTGPVDLNSESALNAVAKKLYADLGTLTGI